jgi:hypothetical protein
MTTNVWVDQTWMDYKLRWDPQVGLTLLPLKQALKTLLENDIVPDKKRTDYWLIKCIFVCFRNMVEWRPYMFPVRESGYQTLYSTTMQVRKITTFFRFPLSLFGLNILDGKYEVRLMTKAELKYTGHVKWTPPAIYKSSCQVPAFYKSSCQVPAFYKSSCQVPIICKSSCQVPVIYKSSCQVPAIYKSSCQVPIICKSSCHVPVIYKSSPVSYQASTRDPV